jgi:hypothetical protein
MVVQQNQIPMQQFPMQQGGQNHMMVTVPMGCSPGSAIQVQTPHGQMIQVQVPMTASPGSQVSLEIAQHSIAQRCCRFTQLFLFSFLFSSRWPMPHNQLWRKHSLHLLLLHSPRSSQHPPPPSHMEYINKHMLRLQRQSRKLPKHMFPLLPTARKAP